MFKPNLLALLIQLARAILPQEKQAQFNLEYIHFTQSLQGIAKHSAPTFLIFVRLSLACLNIYSFFKFGTFLARVDTKRLSRMLNQWSQSKSFIKYILLRPLLVLIYTSYYSHPEVSADLGYSEKKHEIPADEPTLNHGLLEHETIREYLETEICIVGSGAGGAVVAKELAEKGHQVLIVEEGKYFDRAYFNQASTLVRNQTLYRDAGLVTTIGLPMIVLPTGKAVGGTTLINSGTCFRTPATVLDDWMKRFDLSDISLKQLDPYFDRVESILKVSPVEASVLGGNNKKIEAGIQNLNLHGFPLRRNAHQCQGSGACIFGCPTGAKQSVERNYLPLAIKSGAKILSRARAVKLIKKGSQVHSLQVALLDSQAQVERLILIKAKKFIVAGGSLESPLLLQRSGLGGTQVGKNLSIHPTAKMMGLFDEEIKGDFGVPQGYGMDNYEKYGIMFESVFFPPWLLATSIFQSGEKHWEIMKNYKKIGIFGFLVHDESRGVVRAGPKGRPLIFYNLGKKEKELFVTGLKVLGRLFFAAGAKKVYPTLRTMHEVLDQKTLEELNPSQVRRRDIESAGFHPLGTCRMGANPDFSVVDGGLKVHGSDNLWVVDGSVLPTSLGVNPQITIMAFATRAAEMIHAQN